MDSPQCCAGTHLDGPFQLLPAQASPDLRLEMASTDRQRRPQRTVPKPAVEFDDTEKQSISWLPPEIHLAIADYLIYPDALSLKHTSRHFYSIVDTGIELKIDWLMERRRLHLECPNDRRCDLGSDLRFCRGSVPYVLVASLVAIVLTSGRLLMQRRREHIECESRPGLGCLVYGTTTCSHRAKRPSRWRSGLQAKFTIELWWLLLALVPVFCGWIWMSQRTLLP